MSTIVAKKIVINNDMVQQTASHITNLFRPSYNPFKDRAVVDGGAALNQFSLQNYQPHNINNPVQTTYNTKNIVTNLFVCTEDFLTMMNRLNYIIAGDGKPRTMTRVSYSADPATGFIKINPAATDVSAKSVVLPIVQGPIGNYASHMGEYELLAANGLQGIGLSTAVDGVGSNSIPELMLRHMYSIDPKKRVIGFQIAELYYGITSSESSAAQLGFIPAADFNSDNLKITMENDEITLSYENPIELSIHYNETIHNPNGKKLYLYFPYITSNSMRPKHIGTANNWADGPISIYTGTASSDGVDVVPNQQAESYIKAGLPLSFTYRNGNEDGKTNNMVNNFDMPVLTNSVWSVRGEKFVDQCGYTVINISETGGGGDITFDHIDKIDFIDSLKFVIKAPTVFA